MPPPCYNGYMRAIIYARVSTENQDGNFSIPSQLHLSHEYAEKAGLVVVGELHEWASGQLYPRPQLERALKMLEGGEADALIVYEADRLNRSEVNGIFIRHRLSRAGAQLHVATEGLQDLSSDSNLIALVKDHIASLESERISARMQRGLRQKARTGQYPGVGLPPFGYRKVKTLIDGEPFDTLEPDEEMRPGDPFSPADCVRKIYTWYVKELLSMESIAARLTDMGMGRPRPSRAQSKRWPQGAIHRILTSEVYAGVFWAFAKHAVREGATLKAVITAPQDRWIHVEVPALVAREIWERAQRQRLTNSTLSRRNMIHPKLLNKIFTCGECGAVMSTAYNHHGRFYYRCCMQARGRKCKTKYYRTDIWEPRVWAWVMLMVSHPEALWEQLASQRDEIERHNEGVRQEMSLVERNVEAQEEALSNLIDLTIRSQSSRLTASLFEEKRVEIEKAIDGLLEERSRLAGRIVTPAVDDADMAAIMDRLSRLDNIGRLGLEEQRAVFNALGVRFEAAFNAAGEPEIYAVWATRRVPVSAVNDSDNHQRYKESYYIRLPVASAAEVRRSL